MGFSDFRKALKKIDSSLKEHKQQKQGQQLDNGGQQVQQLDNGGQQVQQADPQFSSNPTNPSKGDLFSRPIATSEPPAIFKRVKHNQLPKGCNYGENDAPIQTNNFSNNLALEDQTFPVWPLPYSIWLSKDPGQDVGLAVNHTESNQQVFGPEPDADPAQFYFNPPKIKSFVFSGENFQESNVNLNLENHQKLSIVAKLSITGNQNVTFPIVHGMGFVTAVYKKIKPVIASQVGVQQFKKIGSVGKNVTKYRAVLFNQVPWSIYVSGDDVSLDLRDPNHIVGNSQPGGSVVIQLAREESKHYDNSAGIYPIAAHLQGSVNGKKGQYKFVYENKGESSNGTGLVWCLPHHQEVLTNEVKKQDTGLELDSTTKGVMKAYTTNQIVMEEPELPLDIGFEPWSSVSGFKGKATYSDEAKRDIKRAAEQEINQDVIGMANIDSMYTSGKILDKFAYIAYVTHFILNDDDLTGKILPKIKEAIEIFAQNKQKYPLVYDTAWKGLISSAEPAADFGNSNYNDHHFHYGYHIHAIALVAKIDQSFDKGEWLKENNNLVGDYVITLLRDIANPSTDDKYFPQSRAFDWFHGHSFAHGIFASGDGKDEESSSEDYHFAYGTKLLGQVIGDGDIEARANLMLAIMRRSMNMHMLFSDDNKIQPKRFIKNKVAGITFENKVDFATYFGRGTISDEWIHGIHMLPITPISSYIRKPSFVKEEWDQKLGRIVDQIPDGWKGILILNAALFDPKYSWNWFSRDDWDDRLIDNGMSRTWSLAYIAGIGGSD